ncbi:NAD-dependent epimerase/dehydratase family protein [Streptomyces mobaraensis]|uniref:NAD-dependent epimerase/dehydratase family protein n=1 Tax=Streptomyces mobaraensis TaxID=35621 RepID=UPI0013DF4791|nr:NAD(P)-dependent oxidoreductase [Streptomyces mobaraensis]
MRVAVVGAGGFVGTAITRALGSAAVPVTRATYEEARRSGPFDVLVNTACPSRRYWARQHPDEDRRETVDKTRALLRDWEWGRFVQISTISARTQPDTPYGRNRAEAEELCADHLIVRLGPMYGDANTKGVLMDFLGNQPVYAHGDSRQSFAPVDWCGRWIASHLDAEGLWEVGARTTVSLREIRDAVGSRSVFAGTRKDDQFPLVSRPDWPDAADVIGWLGARSRALTGES